MESVASGDNAKLIEKAKDKLNEKLKTAQIKLRPSFKKLAGLEAYCE